jgi:uncharacterized membrane protein
MPVWEYVVLFGMAATPLLELLVVIPLGIGFGLAPIPVALVAFAGNALPVLLIVAGYDRWHKRRQAHLAGTASDTDTSPSARRERAGRVWHRYGLPGLALLAPLVTGVHLAAIVALAFGSPRRTVGAWMTGAIAVWTVAVTAGIYFGIEGARWIIR